MDGKTTIGVIYPDDHQKPTLCCAADGRVVLRISPNLRRLEPFWVVQRFSYLRAHNPALRMVSLQVADACGIPRFADR